MLYLFGIFGLVLLLSREAIADKVEVTLDSWHKYDNLYKKYANMYGIPWQWVKAVALNESSNGQVASVKRGIENPDDVDGSASQDKKSWGIMQVTLTTARDMDPTATVQKLNNPEYSISLGAKYIAKMLVRFPKSDPRYAEWTIKSYNQGPGNTDKERTGKAGFANEYWERFQRNLLKVQENL